MSDTLPAPPPEGTTPLPPPSETPPPPPPTAAPAPSALKPLLNPLQADTSAPQSTIAEPPRSPNPANPATDDTGRNVDVSEAGGSASAPLVNGTRSGASDASAAQPASQPSPLPSASAPVSAPLEPLVDRPPLPIDAPAPPSPEPPKDEVPPSLPTSAIPSAVPTPTVIAVEEPALAPPAAGPSVSVSPAPGAAPLPAPGVSASPAPPISVAEPAAPAASSALSPAPPRTASPAPPVAASPAPEAPVSVPQPLPSPSPAPTVQSVPAPAEHIAPPASEQPAAPESTPAPAAVPASAPAPSAPTESAPLAPPAAAAPSASPAPPASTTAPPPLSDAPTSVPATPLAATPAASTPAPAPAVNEPASDGMDLDADGEEEVPATNSLKRPGDELEGRDEKRVKEESGAGAGGQAPVPVAGAHPDYRPAQNVDLGPSTPLTQTQHKHLLSSLRGLKKNNYAGIFHYPVDPVGMGIPHYVQVVTRPMDLGTVETKLYVSNPRGPPKDRSKMGLWDESKGRYGSVADVSRDMLQIWENTRMFNGPQHPVSLNADALDKTWRSALKKLPEEPALIVASPVQTPGPAGPSTAPVRRPSVSQVPQARRSEDLTDRPKREIHPPAPKEIPEPARKPKRRNDPLVTWAGQQINNLIKTRLDLTQPFEYPVESIIAAIPDYTKYVKRPIDLNHIKARLAEGEYEDAKDVNADVLLMLSNAMKFNPPDHEVHQVAATFKKVWAEVWKNQPQKKAPVREPSEDVLDEFLGEEEEEEDFSSDPQVAFFTEQLKTVQRQLDARLAELRKDAPPRKAKKAKAPARKQSVSQPKRSPAAPAANGHSQAAAGGANGHAAAPAPKKPRKSKDVSYREEDAYGESEDEEPPMTMRQKQELAEKIQVADGETLGQAIKIIQTSTGLDGTDEIELDIDSLPPHVVQQLYNLVCRKGQRGG